MTQVELVNKRTRVEVRSTSTIIHSLLKKKKTCMICQFFFFFLAVNKFPLAAKPIKYMCCTH